MVGIKWKWVMRYSRRSIGYCWSIIHNNRAAKSAVPVTNCRFNWKTGRDNPFVTLVLPKRRGLINIRRFSLASISLTLPYSATLSVKYSPSTMVLNLNGLFILRFFFNATFFANITIISGKIERMRENNDGGTGVQWLMRTYDESLAEAKVQGNER